MPSDPESEDDDDERDREPGALSTDEVDRRAALVDPAEASGDLLFGDHVVTHARSPPGSDPRPSSIVEVLSFVRRPSKIDQRSGEVPRDDDVHQRREPEEEGEAPDVADGDEVSNRYGGEQADGVSAAKTVRHAERNPRSTEVRIERPARASSFKRSKYTM